MKKPLVRLVLAIAAGYVILVLVLAALQRQMIYFPMHATEADLLARAGELGLEPWRDKDSRLIGWKTPKPGSLRYRLVVFHGNAGYALHRDYFIGLPPGTGWQVYLFEYPGYGARPGEPGEETIKDAALRAFDELRAESPDARYLLVGESIGSGVAAWLAGRRPKAVSGVLLITPMTSLVDVASHHYPWLPTQQIMRDRYDSEEALRDYPGPVAVVVAGRDEVVPAKLGRRLFESYQGQKKLWEQPEAGHNTVNYLPRWWAPVFNFLTPGGAD